MQLSQRYILFYESLTHSFNTIQPLLLSPKALIKAPPTGTRDTINTSLIAFLVSSFPIIVIFLIKQLIMSCKPS